MGKEYKRVCVYTHTHIYITVPFAVHLNYTVNQLYSNLKKNFFKIGRKKKITQGCWDHLLPPTL